MTNIVVTEVAFAKTSLNDEDVFVYDGGKELLLVTHVMRNNHLLFIFSGTGKIATKMKNSKPSSTYSS